MTAEAHPSAGLGWHRLRVALVALTVFGLPLALMAIYLGTRELPVRPPFDAQPGGTLSGRVMHARATPLVGVPVEVQL